MRCSKIGQLAVGVVIAVSLLIGGCDVKVGDEVNNAAPVPRESLASAMARAFCEGLANCCQGAGQLVNLAACESFEQDSFRSNFQDLNGPSVQYDPLLGGQCVAEIRSAIAGCYSLHEGYPASCYAMFVGTIPPGGVCSSSRDCAPPSIGYPLCGTPGTSPSVCGTEPSSIPAALGQSCAATCEFESNGRSPCMGSAAAPGAGLPPAGAGSCFVSDGLYCQADTWTCQQVGQVAVGGPCYDQWGCVDAARCDYSALQCVPTAALGAACSNSSDCIASAYCDGNGSCQPKKSDGQNCSMADDCTGYCLVAAGATSGTCASGRVRIVPTVAVCQDY